jgi:hypothetical protein
MSFAQDDPYSPAVWEFIRDRLGTQPLQDKTAAGGWLGGMDWSKGNYIPDWLVGGGGSFYNSDYDAASNLSGIFGQAGSIGAGALGAAAGGPTAPLTAAAGGAAGGMAGRGVGRALGNTWLGELLNRHTGNGSQTKESLPEATWGTVASDAAFSGVVGMGKGVQALRAAASPNAATKILANRLAQPGRTWTQWGQSFIRGAPKQYVQQAKKQLTGLTPGQRALKLSPYSNPISGGAKATAYRTGMPLLVSGGLAGGAAALSSGVGGGGTGGAPGDNAGQRWRYSDPTDPNSTMAYTGVVGTDGGFGDARM